MDASYKPLSWPAAATIIAALVGAVAASLALAITPGREPVTVHPHFASAREIGEVTARLTALEVSTQQLRSELRSDLKELRELVGELVKQQ
jgi:hypothetical protein